MLLLIEPCEDMPLLLELVLEGLLRVDDLVLIVIGGVMGGARIGVEVLALACCLVIVVPLADVEGVPANKQMTK